MNNRCISVSVTVPAEGVVRVDGGESGAAPFELLATALARCAAETVRDYAREQGWPLEQVMVEVEHEKGPVEGRHGLVDIFRKTVDIRGDDLTEGQHERLLEAAARCPVHRTLESDPSITTLAANPEGKVWP